MQSLKIIIAAAIVMFMSNILTSCSLQSPSEVGIQRLEEAQQYKKTVELKLEVTEAEAGRIMVRVLLDNPEGKPLTSAQTWFTYNPEVLQGVEIRTADSAFELVAPYDNDFDQEGGLVMIGRSTAEAVTETYIVVADIVFTRVGPGAAMIEAYDYQIDLEGHTSANMVLDENPYNMLLKPDSPLLIINEDNE